MLKCQTDGCDFVAMVGHSWDKAWATKYELATDDGGDEAFCLCPQCGAGVYSTDKPHFIRDDWRELAEPEAFLDSVVKPLPGRKPVQERPTKPFQLRFTPGGGGYAGKIEVVREGEESFANPFAEKRGIRTLEFNPVTGEVKHLAGIKPGPLERSDPPQFPSAAVVQRGKPPPLVSADDMI